MWLLLLFSLVAVACGGTGSNQQPVAGGFVDVAGDPSVRAVADFAVAEISKKTNDNVALKRVVSAERQVVAGLNYRLELELTKNSQPFRVRAVVWQKPGGVMELTNWNPI